MTLPVMSFSATSVSAGFDHTCAVSTNREVWCWGGNSDGELGDGTLTDRAEPRPVPGMSGVRSVASGFSGACALTTAGAVWCWGANDRGQLGNGTTTLSAVPVPVTGLGSGVDSIAVVAAHTCARLTNGVVKCWGDNSVGQLGTPGVSQSSVPSQVAGLPAVSSLGASSSNNDHTCVVLGSGAVSCWGLNYAGELGNGTNIDSPTPVPVIGLSGPVARVAMGGRHTCAVLQSGAAQCWGYDGGVLLGDGGVFTGVFSSAPVSVSGLAGTSYVAAGGVHNCALLGGGVVKCWGANAQGAVGDGTFTDRNVPSTAIAGGASMVSAGSTHSCAVVAGGSIRCWGSNGASQLGVRGTAPSAAPVTVLGT